MHLCAVRPGLVCGPGATGGVVADLVVTTIHWVCLGHSICPCVTRFDGVFFKLRMLPSGCVIPSGRKEPGVWPTLKISRRTYRRSGFRGIYERVESGQTPGTLCLRPAHDVPIWVHKTPLQVEKSLVCGPHLK